MPKNKVQFQKGQSLPEFLELYGTVAQCEQAVFAARWPKGADSGESERSIRRKVNARSGGK